LELSTIHPNQYTKVLPYIEIINRADRDVQILLGSDFNTLTAYADLTRHKFDMRSGV